jgi:hypothetical protein
MQNVKMQMNKLNKFGLAAVLATELVTRNQNLSPVDDWKKRQWLFSENLPLKEKVVPKECI